MNMLNVSIDLMFYDNLISSGTKIHFHSPVLQGMFYDNLISSGTKIAFTGVANITVFYDNLISSGTKISNLLSRRIANFLSCPKSPLYCSILLDI